MRFFNLFTFITSEAAVQLERPARLDIAAAHGQLYGKLLPAMRVPLSDGK